MTKRKSDQSIKDRLRFETKVRINELASIINNAEDYKKKHERRPILISGNVIKVRFNN